MIKYRILRASRICRGKARSAGNIEHIDKGRNTALVDARSSLVFEVFPE